MSKARSSSFWFRIDRARIDRSRNAPADAGASLGAQRIWRSYPEDLAKLSGERGPRIEPRDPVRECGRIVRSKARQLEAREIIHQRIDVLCTADQVSA